MEVLFSWVNPWKGFSDKTLSSTAGKDFHRHFVEQFVAEGIHGTGLHWKRIARPEISAVT